MLCAGAVVALGACGAGHPGAGAPPGERSAAGTLPADYLPLPPGRGRGYRLTESGAAVGRRARVSGLRCTRSHPIGYGIHLDLYAHRLVVPIPAGIGLAPPLRRAGVYVRSGACAYPLRTYEPTGLVVLDPGPRLTLGQLFRVWEQPLSDRRLAGFTGAVRAYVDGRRWPAAPGALPLRRHTEIVVEIGGWVPPHSAYLFPRGR